MVRSYIMVTCRLRIGITSSTTSTVGALLRAWKAAVTSSNVPHACHAVFSIVGKRRCLITACGGVKCEKSLGLFALANISGVCQHQLETRSKARIRKCIGIFQLRWLQHPYRTITPVYPRLSASAACSKILVQTCRPTIGRLSLAQNLSIVCRPTNVQQSADRFYGKLFFHNYR